MFQAIQRHLLAAALALGVLVGMAPAPAEAADHQPATVQSIQYYGGGPGYRRGPPPGYYGRGYRPAPRYYGRGPGYYGRGPGYGRGPRGGRYYR